MKITAYYKPESVPECLGMLTELEGDGRLISGGTDLMLDIESRRKSPKALVDISGIKGMGDIDITDRDITIHAGVTHAGVCRHLDLKTMVPALAQACGSVGSPQIRNIATLSGNVVNAQPAADSAIALIALGAKAVIQNPSGTRTEPVESLFAGPGQSRVDSTSEILTSFVIERTRENRATAYGRISPRTSLCLPIVNTGVTLQVDDRGKICDAKIVIAPVAKTPLLAESACQALIGGDVDDEDLFVRAASEASRAANPRSSCLRGCSDYRKQLVYVLTRRIIAQAASTLQARQKGK